MWVNSDVARFIVVSASSASSLGEASDLSTMNRIFDMQQQQVFSFNSITFEQGLAHDGCAFIFFKRVTECAKGSACNFIDFVVIPAGADIGKHKHALDNEETYIILEGRGMMCLEEKEFEVEPGHVIVNRPGGTHGLRNISDTDLKLVVFEVLVHPNRQD
jgi:mannose-6-phosphate isomerase-like protein (cupin superfamily)